MHSRNLVTSTMEQEARSAPKMIRQQLDAGDAAYADLGRQLRAAPPRQAFYILAAQLAAARGLDPDQPRHLQKVTRTH